MPVVDLPFCPRPAFAARVSFFSVSSSALGFWQGERSDHLDELVSAHSLVSGPARGRRWRTQALNEALILRLAVEFQGFARDLHDLSCEYFALWTSPSSSALQGVIQNALRLNRDLDRGNAQPGSLGKDFGRFGFELWPALALRTRTSKTLNDSLERLNTARNGLAHADEVKLAGLKADGYPIVLNTFRKWRKHLDLLSEHLDAEVSSQLAKLFGQPAPW